MKPDRIGALLVLVSAVAFSAKAIFVKLAYAGAGNGLHVDPSHYSRCACSPRCLSSS